MGGKVRIAAKRSRGPHILEVESAGESPGVVDLVVHRGIRRIFELREFGGEVDFHISEFCAGRHQYGR